jgi:hypothetical protein
MITSRSRRRRVLVLLGLASVLAVSACKATDPAQPASEAFDVVDAAPPTTPAPSSPAPVPSGPGNLVALFPATPKAYATAVINAWTQDHINTLGSLTTPEVQEQILEIPQPLDDAWSYLRCDGTAGSSYCTFANADGDEFTLRISHLLLGKPHAAIEVMLDLTEYPNDGLAYVKEFVAAWQIGNTARMLKLSKPSIVDQLGAAPVSPSYPAPVCCGGGLLQVTVKWTASSVRFDVGTTLLGDPHAIVGYAPAGLGLTWK